MDGGAKNVSFTQVCGVRKVIRVRGRGESPEGMYRVGEVDDDRRWVQDGKDRVGRREGD